MPDASNPSQQSESTRSRRQILKATTAAASALTLGTGIAAAGPEETGRFNDAPGRGGEAVVPADDYRPQSFHITARTGDTAEEIDGVLFQCNDGDGESIFLVGWEFQYVDEDDTHLLFTRSNNLDTDPMYDWSDNGSKVCPKGGTIISGDGISPPEDFVQVSYRATGPQ